MFCLVLGVRTWNAVKPRTKRSFVVAGTSPRRRTKISDRRAAIWMSIWTEWGFFFLFANVLTSTFKWLFFPSDKLWLPLFFSEIFMYVSMFTTNNDLQFMLINNKFNFSWIFLNWPSVICKFLVKIQNWHAGSLFLDALFKLFPFLLIINLHIWLRVPFFRDLNLCVYAY